MVTVSESAMNGAATSNSGPAAESLMMPEGSVRRARSVYEPAGSAPAARRTDSDTAAGLPSLTVSDLLNCAIMIDELSITPLVLA